MTQNNTVNQQQEDINNTFGKNVIVSASAGTGKTTTLTARITNYIKDGEDISNYLIVSFTDAAAGELKSKISSKLKEFIADPSFTETQKNHFRNQLAKIPVANISTIHAFCLDVIRKYGYVLDIDPGSCGKLADDGQLRKMKDLAFKKAVNYQKNNTLLYRFLDRPEDLSAFQKQIERIDSFIQNLSDYQGWKSKQLENYELMAKKDFSKYPVDLDRHLQTLLDAADNSFHEWYSICEGFINPKSAAADKVKIMQDSIANAKEFLSKKDYEQMARCLFKADSYPDIPKAKKFPEDAKEEAKRLKEECNAALEELKTYHKFFEACRENEDVVKAILEIAEDYRKYYDQLKKESRVIGYEDMLVMTDRILKENNGQVADIYRKHFNEIMVDEYQDTNENQENIIRSISRPDNVFRVGDIKQSIYRFQNAKPELMKGFIENQGPNDVVLPLQTNYRSYPNILAFSNFVFNKLMNIEKGTYDPDKDDLRVCDKYSNVQGDNIKLVTVPYVSDAKDSNGKAEKKYKAPDKVAAIGEYIASEMVRLHDERKDLKWSDFVILVRTNKHKRLLKKILSDHNVPVFTVTKTGFFLDAAVSGVIALLNLIVQDSRKNAYNVLTGPMFSRSAQEIAENKGLLDLTQASELSDLINDLRKNRKDHSLSQLLDIIYNNDGFYMEKISSFQRSNLDSLYYMAVEFQKNNDNLLEFINNIEALKTVDKEEANSFISKDDAVQIMTVHQSKGLKFDYVFLADLQFGSNSTKYNDLVSINEKMGIAPKYVSLPFKIRHGNPYYDLVNDANKKEDFQEELRILYVAVTRAAKGLYVVNANEDKTDKCDLSFEGLFSKGFMDWIKTALNSPDNKIKSIVDIISLNEKELKDHCRKAAQKSATKKFDGSFKDPMQIDKMESRSPSSLESRYISTLDFHSSGFSAARGTLMHKAIELLGIKEVTVKDIDDLNLKLSGSDKDKIIRFYNDPLTVSLRNNRNEHEYPFICLNNDTLENGIIDLLSIGEKVYVIDFKSDRNTTEEKLKERYSEQLNAYRSIVEKQYADKEIQTLIYSFELGKYVDISPKESEEQV